MHFNRTVVRNHPHEIASSATKTAASALDEVLLKPLLTASSNAVYIQVIHLGPNRHY